MNGEPIAYRPNCAVLTRLTSLIGRWRFEMNQSSTFQEVAEPFLPPIMRRSLVVLLKARVALADVLSEMSFLSGDPRIA